MPTPATFLAVANNATSTLAKAATAAATEVELISGGHAPFPATVPFNVSIDKEILHVTKVTGDVFTVERGAEGTAAEEHLTGAACELHVTAKSVSDLNAAVNQLEGGLLYYPEAVAAELTENPTKNLALPEHVSVALKASVNNLKIESIVAPAEGGRLVQLINNSASNTINLVGKAAGAGANVIFVWGEALTEYPLRAKAAIWLWYNATTKAWYIVPQPALPSTPAAGANGTITVGSAGLPKANTAVIVGDGVTNVWKVKHGLQSTKLVVQFAENATGTKPIPNPFQVEEYKGTEAVFETEAGKTLAAAAIVWIKMVAVT